MRFLKNPILLAGSIITVGLAVTVGIIYTTYQQSRLHTGTTATAQALGAYLAKAASADKFSGTILLAKNGQPLLEQGYGFANRQKNIPNTPQTKYCIASMGKMFTAVAIAQLVQQGKLSFGDAIGKYIHDFPASEANSITIADLLMHRSGLGDVALQPDSRGNLATTLQAMVSKIAEEKLQFAPGTSFSYSNDGFILLGDIVQIVSGQSYNDYIQQHIFHVANMNNTVIANYKAADINGMAHGYAVDSAGNISDTATTLQVGNPSGGAYSTVEDMLRFAQALTSHRLVNATLTNEITTGKEKTNRPGGPAYDTYGYGFADVRINGVRIIGHNGGNPGYEDQLDIYPDKGYVVVMMTNQANELVPAIQKAELLLTS